MAIFWGPPLAKLRSTLYARKIASSLTLLLLSLCLFFALRWHDESLHWSLSWILWRFSLTYWLPELQNQCWCTSLRSNSLRIQSKNIMSRRVVWVLFHSQRPFLFVATKMHVRIDLQFGQAAALEEANDQPKWNILNGNPS